MTNEEAIVAFKLCRDVILFDILNRKEIDYDSLNLNNCTLYDACGVAISALQEREERSKGCDFCKKELDDYPYIVAQNDKDSSSMVYEPKFCPLCGKCLKEGE